MVSEALRIEHAGFVMANGVHIDDFSISMHSGEIMGLVSIDGFGVDAIFELIQNNPQLNYGYVYMNDRLVNSWDKHSKKMNRVSIVRGRSALAGELTVADNVFVLRHGFRKYVIRPEQLKKQLEPFFTDAGVSIPADKHADELTEYERITVEIMKAVVAGNWLIAIDEPDTLISSADLGRIHKLLSYCAEKGLTILYISSHYENIVSLCDRIALMENGQIIKYFNAGDRLPGVSELLKIGRGDVIAEDNGDKGRDNSDTEDNGNKGRDNSDTDNVETSVHSAGYDTDGENQKRDFGMKEALVFDNVTDDNIFRMNFKLMHGQCVMINDLVEKDDIACLEDLISGNRFPVSGCIYLDGRKITCPAGRKIAVIPPSPEKSLLFPDMSYMDNLCMTVDERVKNVWSSGRIRRSLRKEIGDQLDESLFDVNVKLLTAEEKKELVYRRIMLQKPSVVMIVQPFRASGFASRRHTVGLIRHLIERGTAVVLVSAGMTDAIMITDNIIQVSAKS